MTFEERLKKYRKLSGLSQEKMAEKIGVSRQAVTKWETGTGIPDISNMIAIAKLFQISLDELMAGKNSEKNDYLYESITQYDIDGIKNYDIKLGGANKVIVSSSEDEKVKIRLASNTIENLQSSFKIKLDDTDIELNRIGDMTETIAKEELAIFIILPEKYIGKTELAVNAKVLELHNISCKDFELDGKIGEIILDGGRGEVEIDCNIDMIVRVLSHEGAISINQFSSTSKIIVPENFDFRALKRGFANKISYESADGSADFSNENAEENIIELNGMKSELIISRMESV